MILPPKNDLQRSRQHLAGNLHLGRPGDVFLEVASPVFACFQWKPFTTTRGWCLHAVGGVGADEVLGVDFSGNDADVGVPAGTLVAVRALTQSVGVHFLHFGALLDAEQPARLLPLAPQPLQRCNVKRFIPQLLRISTRVVSRVPHMLHQTHKSGSSSNT